MSRSPFSPSGSPNLTEHFKTHAKDNHSPAAVFSSSSPSAVRCSTMSSATTSRAIASLIGPSRHPPADAVPRAPVCRLRMTNPPAQMRHAQGQSRRVALSFARRHPNSDRTRVAVSTRRPGDDHGQDRRGFRAGHGPPASCMRARPAPASPKRSPPPSCPWCRRRPTLHESKDDMFDIQREELIWGARPPSWSSKPGRTGPVRPTAPSSPPMATPPLLATAVPRPREAKPRHSTSCR